MNINLTVTLTASPELLTILHALANLAISTDKEKEKEKVKAIPAKPAKENKLSAVTTEEKTSAEKLSDITIADVRAVAVPLSKAGHKDAIKKKITELGAGSLDTLDAQHFGEFLEFLNALKS